MGNFEVILGAGEGQNRKTAVFCTSRTPFSAIFSNFFGGKPDRKIFSEIYMFFRYVSYFLLWNMQCPHSSNRKKQIAKTGSPERSELVGYDINHDTLPPAVDAVYALTKTDITPLRLVPCLL